MQENEVTSVNVQPLTPKVVVRPIHGQVWHSPRTQNQSQHGYLVVAFSRQWWIQTGAMGCRKPMKNANLNLIQYINFVLNKNNEQGKDSIFRRGDDFLQIGNSYMKQAVSRPAAEVTGYLPVVITD